MRDLHQVDDGWAAIGGTGLIYEKFQKFSRELSIVGARSAAGHTVFYPLSANSHGGGIPHYSIAPFSKGGPRRPPPPLFKTGMNRPPDVGVPPTHILVCQGRLFFPR